MNWIQAYEAQTDLQDYGDNAIGVFALGLRFGLDDLATVAANAITDGADDKKCDIVHVDKDDRLAVIAQCYIGSKTKAAAPANKASDLNTGVSWLLQRPNRDLPERLRPAAIELRQAIEDNLIDELHVWYVHNRPESENVKQELLTVERTCESILQNHFPKKKVIVRAQEVGHNKLEEWYNETQSPILVSDIFSLKVPDGFEVAGKDWKAFVTTVPGSFIHKAYEKHGAKLFSANVRDYLGSRRSDMNINNGIKRTAQEAPGDFWVFNNGLTVLVHSYEIGKDSGSGRTLTVTGMSIVNGAQTTGAIGSLTKKPSNDLAVPARFVVTGDADTVFDIIQYNNSQNKVTASDFRSRDKLQRRLKEEVFSIPHAFYQGGRRGGASDVIRRNPEVLPSYTVGQALAAAQLDPDVAYNEKSNIWASDALYSKYFNEDTTGAHIVFAYSLVRAIEARKTKLVARSKAAVELTEPEKKELQYFRQRGSMFLLASAMSSCLETIVGRRIGKVSRVSFGNRCSPADAQTIWGPVLNVCAAFCPQLESACGNGLTNKEKIRNVLETFQSLVQATAQVNTPTFKAFAAKVRVA